MTRGILKIERIVSILSGAFKEWFALYGTFGAPRENEKKFKIKISFEVMLMLSPIAEVKRTF
jgi:hypothetical protein